MEAPRTAGNMTHEPAPSRWIWANVPPSFSSTAWTAVFRRLHYDDAPDTGGLVVAGGGKAGAVRAEQHSPDYVVVADVVVVDFQSSPTRRSATHAG